MTTVVTRMGCAKCFSADTNTKYIELEKREKRVACNEDAKNITTLNNNSWLQQHPWKSRGDISAGFYSI